MFLRFMFILSLVVLWPSERAGAQTDIPLVVSQGFPLRVVLTNKLRYKRDEPVQAQLVEPVFSFDREMIPQGTQVDGRISGFQRPPKWRRVLAILNGDLTPLREPQITFDALI